MAVGSAVWSFLRLEASLEDPARLLALAEVSSATSSLPHDLPTCPPPSSSRDLPWGVASPAPGLMLHQLPGWCSAHHGYGRGLF